MNDKELYDFDQKMVQNEKNGNFDAQQIQSQPYETSYPQSKLYMPPPQTQSQVYIQTPQPQTNEASQPYQSSESFQLPEAPLPQPYQTYQPQIYQQNKPQFYHPPQTQNKTLYINPPLNNNMYQDGSNQSSNYVTSQNDLIDNYKPFQDDLNAPNKRRLICQLILAILLLLSLGLSYFEFIMFGSILEWSLMRIYLNLIIGIWMIILTIKKQDTRNCRLASISLISLFASIFVLVEYYINACYLHSELVLIIILIIIVSFNMECKRCNKQ